MAVPALEGALIEKERKICTQQKRAAAKATKAATANPTAAASASSSSEAATMDVDADAHADSEDGEDEGIVLDDEEVDTLLSEIAEGRIVQESAVMMTSKNLSLLDNEEGEEL